MLQRIQTIYLALIVISIGLMFFTNLCTLVFGDSQITFSAMEITENSSSFKLNTTPISIMSSLAILVIAIALFSIMKFKQRALQIKLCRINMLLILGLLLAVFYGSDSIQNFILSQQPEQSIEFKANIGTLFPILCIIFNLLASKAIKKDEALVRSANRIR
jgi:glucan phosphoethanolaminetransferase (alkaline phosphatase superfamily)